LDLLIILSGVPLTLNNTCIVNQTMVMRNVVDDKNGQSFFEEPSKNANPTIMVHNSGINHKFNLLLPKNEENGDDTNTNKKSESRQSLLHAGANGGSVKRSSKASVEHSNSNSSKFIKLKDPIDNSDIYIRKRSKSSNFTFIKNQNLGENTQFI